jgi:uncharacterized protein DUF4440
MQKVLTLAVLTAIILSCNAKDKSNKGAEAQLLRLNYLYDSALLIQDTGFLKRLYAEDFVYTNPEGKLLNKEQQIISIAVSEMKWDAGKSDDVRVKIYDDIAVMTGAFRASGTYRGNPISIHERYTAVWKQKDTTWQMIAEQGNIIAGSMDLSNPQ